MLLEIGFKNFKTFVQKTVFSMIPVEDVSEMNYSIIQKKTGIKTQRALVASVIYGPNSAGKTNIISAMEVLRGIVLRGHIKNGEDAALELIPSAALKKTQPVEFFVKFVENDLLFRYDLKLGLGKFLDKKYKRSVLQEKLTINGKMIFERKGTDDLKIGNLSRIKKQLVMGYDKDASYRFAQGNLDRQELFLTGQFRAVYSSEIASIIIGWFKHKLMPYTGVLPTQSGKDNPIYYNGTISKAAKVFAIGAKDVTFAKTGESGMDCVVKNGDFTLPASIFASFGTERFLNVYPLVLRALATGGVLAVDEFDASIHPMAIISIIGLFRDDLINKKGAQLIFNTHNPIFLNKNVFRRDEIGFVDRDEKTGYSTHYYLSDFGTHGPDGVSQDEDYMKHYFISQYGAIKDIDFSEIVQEQLERIDQEK